MRADVAEWHRTLRLIQAAAKVRPLTDSEQQLETSLRITLRKHFIAAGVEL